MGQLLSHPVDDKVIESHTSHSLSYTVGTMQGYRMSMEDAHDVLIDPADTLAVFGVFDGHGGSKCSQYLSHHLVKHIYRSLALLRHARTCSAAIATMRDAFFACDAKLAHDSTMVDCGSTAVVAAIVREKYVVVANTGDSRCILSLDGHAKTMSFDHKPTGMGERVRIENSNGYVMSGRINGVLALSRAFGDFKFKNRLLKRTENVFLQQGQDMQNCHVKLPPELVQVTVEPEFLVYDMTTKYAEAVEAEFLILACDGIWDCYKNEDLVRDIRNKLAQEWTLTKITEFILNRCLQMANNYTGIGFDNMTLIIVALHPGRTMEEWYVDMRKKVSREKTTVVDGHDGK